MGKRRTFADEADDLIRQAMEAGPSEECILWPHWRDRDGYARAWRDGKSFAPHRKACAVKHGEPPEGKPFALHSCHNGNMGCFNPHHVYWGTHVDNMSDMVAAGRSTFGESCPSAKLTEPQVLRIRELRGLARQCDLARDFGVSARTIGKIHRREIWSHLHP